ncbi:MAG: hypothetical protein IPG53_11925 [Ignavibacteriales bacterium]|nr:hypothetical protein [Ignavibacteriales bacterium]
MLNLKGIMSMIPEFLKMKNPYFPDFELEGNWKFMTGDSACISTMILLTVRGRM